MISFDLNHIKILMDFAEEWIVEHINPTGIKLHLYIWEEIRKRVNIIILMSDNMFSWNLEYILALFDTEMI